MQILAWVVTPMLPAFAEIREGPLDNNNGFGYGYRLPKWLSWFDTPDNPLEGDSGFQSREGGYSYLNAVKWLYRNSLYGLKWGLLAARIDDQRVFNGNPQVNYKGPVYGLLRVSCGKYWQWKKVTPLWGDYCAVLNFGWLLDDESQERALFMFSPRIKKVKYDRTQSTG